ncbi:MAG: response regulator transcription factor, partial [Chloroflexi bacterium]|nr:response regulator transcription factor [Chloroflexota bacterium]
VLRRTKRPEAPQEILEAGNIRIDPVRFLASCQGRKLELTTTEFRLLSALAKSPGRVFTRMQLLEIIQGEAYEGYERTIDAHIKNLRHKIVSPACEPGCRIETVRQVGYKLEAGR